MRIGAWMALLTGMLTLVACGNGAMSSTGSGSGGGPSMGDATFDPRGTWQISTLSQSGATGGAVATIQRNPGDGSLTGSLSNIDPPCATSASLSGNINANKIQLSADENGQTVNFTGSATATGGLSGTYTSSTGGCTKGDTGTWTATRTSPPS